jgi:hypothetical protein
MGNPLPEDSVIPDEFEDDTATPAGDSPMVEELKAESDGSTPQDSP